MQVDNLTLDATAFPGVEDVNNAEDLVPSTTSMDDIANTLRQLNKPKNDDWGRWGSVVGSLFLMVVVRFVTTALTLTCSVPCGCLMPVLLIGAGVGRCYGELVTSDIPASFLTYDSTQQLRPTDFAAAGAAAFVGGVTGTVSISVIVFELTNQIHFSLPLLVSV